ncbi:MAG: aldo/keto reductase, partial [Anaerolineae bacterium]|nr:aldo/keto reductase [Anaerolineae bacterium]
LGTAHIAGFYGSPPSEERAINIVRLALESGMNFFDTAPLYQTEKYLGKALAGVPRDSYVLATKIGRLPNPDGGHMLVDYSRDGVLRSLENSLRTLNIDRIDILHIHDPDNHYKQAIGEAFPALAELRSQGVIKAVGAGMNQWQMLVDFAHDGDFDCFLLAGRYTLLEQHSLNALNLFHEKQISIFAGGVFNSGILATGAVDQALYQYRSAPDDIKEKVRHIQAICERYDIPLNAAAVQFVKAHPAVASLVLGADSPEQITSNRKTLDVKIPAEFWAELRADGLIAETSPDSERGTSPL